ncbi:hypothetical protein JCM10908_002968 [Rhodotorula pacifica]|uniref:RNA-binding motif protein 42 n=1 Tax=Rhodotorula pacifica TaxID=1495444 RepID=UPI00317F3DDC
MSNNPYARPSKPYAAYGASSYYANPTATSSSSSAAAAYPAVAAASTSAYGAVAAGPVMPAGYGGYHAAGPMAGPAYPGAGNLDAQQASIYTPEAAKAGKPTGPATATAGGKGKGRTTVLRKGGGEVWEDQSLLEWDPSHFRLFIGDLDPAISDDSFRSAFSGDRFPSFVKSKVIRDKYTNKGKGYGFVSYSDPEDFLKAWKEMNGKYVGTRPVTIKKANAGVKAVEIGNRKARELEAKRPQKTGTVAYERANAEDAGHRAIPGEKGYGPQRTRKQYIRR